MVSKFEIKVNDQLKDVVFEKYNDLLGLDVNEKQILGAKIHSILIDCWGKFHEEFIEKHILAGNRLIMAKVDDHDVGFCVLSLKKICGINVHYIEFLAIKRDFQKSGIGPRLFYLIIKDDIKRNIFNLFYKPIEIMFITPNIRALMRMAKFAGFIYPNPHLADDNGAIPQADDLTWKMAQGLIDLSDKPDRKLYREGLVLEGSYTETPWLIYGPENAPWVKDPQVIKFVKKYLGYHNKEDKELVVRAHITLGSVIKYLFSNK